MYNLVNPDLYGVKIMNPLNAVTMDSGLGLQKKPLVIYHGNCADGFSAAWVFHYFDPNAFEFHAATYGDLLPDVQDRVVYCVDFSYSPEETEEILTKAYELVMLDHHKTAVDRLAYLKDHPRMQWFCDLSRSGAMLAWDYWFNTAVVGDKREWVEPTQSDYMEAPHLLAYVQDRDLWKFKLPDSKEVSAYIFSHKYSFELWDQLMGSDVMNVLEARSAGAGILRKQNKDIEEFIKASVQTVRILDDYVPICNAPYMWGSDLAAKLLEIYPEVPYAGYYWDSADKRNWGLRSRGDIDVAAIAERFGGGGHKGASGFKTRCFDRVATKDHYSALSFLQKSWETYQEELTGTKGAS